MQPTVQQSIEAANLAAARATIDEAERVKLEAERLEAERKQQELAAKLAAERAVYLNDQRLERNARFDKINAAGNFDMHQESYASTKPGTGYHFDRNVRLSDGNYYAVFKTNRGQNEKYYSISERKWMNPNEPSSPYCQSCGNYGMIGYRQFDMTCPDCGTVRKADG